jgi:hypothetical protein
MDTGAGILRLLHGAKIGFCTVHENLAGGNESTYSVGRTLQAQHSSGRAIGTACSLPAKRPGTTP